MVQSPSITPAVLDKNGRTIQDVYRNGPISFNGTVTNSGTRVQAISTATEAKVIDIFNNNASAVLYIGGSTVSSTKGVPLYPSQTYRLQVWDVSQIWIDSDTSAATFEGNYFF